MKKIGFILTAEFAVRAFLINHLRELSKYYDLTVIVNTDNPDFLDELGVNATVIVLPISRKINPVSDVIVLLRLIKVLMHHQFDAVHTLMPKAGLLGGLAAKLTAVPVRVHMFTGQVWVTRKGFSQFFFKTIDRLIGRLTTINLVDGHAQLRFLIEQKILTAERSTVFLQGSIAGVDLVRFKADDAKRASIRANLNIDSNAVVFLFIGRLNQEKGVVELAEAFAGLNNKQAHLVYVGPDEAEMKALILARNPSIQSQMHFIDYTHEPEAYMASADVLCLPSYREGFNNVVIEAAAVGLPAIASDIYGVAEAVDHQVTGLLHPVKDVGILKAQMQTLIDQPDLRQTLGQNAREHIIKNFNAQALTKAWVNFYHQLFSHT